MPATPPHVRVRTAERPGSPNKPSEDRIFTTDNAVIVLDGASQPEVTDRNGGWLAQQLGSTLADHLTAYPGDDLADALAASIGSVAYAYDLAPGESPSTTVTIVRWTDARVDVLVLCDSPALVVTTDGIVHPLEDDRLAAVTARLQPRRSYDADDTTRWNDLVEVQRQQRNRAGGYWVAEATPAAAHQAIRASWPISEVTAVVAMTDGVSIGVERYRRPADWQTAAAIAAEDPKRLIELVQAAEDTDLTGVRWRRSKAHDDKAVAVVHLGHRPGDAEQSGQ